MQTDVVSVRRRAASLLTQAFEQLTRAGVETAKLDSELLLAEAAAIDRGKILTGSFTLDDECLRLFQQFVARRAAREPFAYIVGHKEFDGLEFEVNRDVLIPRPETELLVEAALGALCDKPDARVLDLGTGSGAIAVTIAVKARQAMVTATDISDAALEVARRNARRHGCENRIEFLHGDEFAAIPCSHPKFDLILCNPPYIRDDEIARLQPEVARYEPSMALRGGNDGLDFYRHIAASAGSFLRPVDPSATGGEVIVEVGAGQAAQVVRILQQGGCGIIETIKDLAGHERVVRARLKD
jgi:release factor glutamine methyltransferase